MDGPTQTYETHSSSRVFERSEEELQNVNSEGSNCSSGTFETETDSKDTENITQRRNEVLLTGLYQKLSAVQWKNAFTLFVVVVDYFLVNGSVSLIATFFPTKVATKLFINVLVFLAVHMHTDAFHDIALHTCNNYYV